jgi:hypothetical protein
LPVQVVVVVEVRQAQALLQLVAVLAVLAPQALMAQTTRAVELVAYEATLLDETAAQVS